jgi:hypothetical protein
MPYYEYMKGNKFACMDEEVLALPGRQRGGGAGCWFLIDLSTLQRNSVGAVVCSLQLRQGLSEMVVTWTSAPLEGIDIVSFMSRSPWSSDNLMVY